MFFFRFRCSPIEDIESQPIQHSSAQALDSPTQMQHGIRVLENQYTDERSSTKINHVDYGTEDQDSRTQRLGAYPGNSSNLTLSQKPQGNRNATNIESRYSSNSSNTQILSYASHQDHRFTDTENQYPHRSFQSSQHYTAPDTHSLPRGPRFQTNSFHLSTVKVPFKMLAPISTPQTLSCVSGLPPSSVSYPMNTSTYIGNEDDIMNNKSCQSLPRANLKDWDDKEVCFSPPSPALKCSIKIGVILVT